MSMDTVDDLHQAEDMVDSFAAAARAVLANERGSRKRLRALISMADEYCRPTCEGKDCEEGWCGCLCHLREEEQ